MELKPGYTVTLEVARKAKFGYFLSDGKTDILMHENDVEEEVETGSHIEVFLYHDHQNRLSATTKKPLIQGEGFAWLEVVSVKTGHGLFLFNGISRDLFLSMDELPSDRNLWPKPGDKLPVSYTWDKKGRLMSRLVKGQPIEEQSVRATEDMMSKEVKGHVYHYLDEGAAIFTEEGYLAYLHDNEMIKEPRYGEEVTVRVIYVREDGRINVTMHPLRSERQEDDAEKLVRYMEERGGQMPYWDKSQPEDIKHRFNLSKAAFKRALGKLLKEKKIEQREGWTYLKEKK
ncbi:S1-like domain-containing RNA-binding protein [Alkalihalophilus lindianensis]|uniref:S1-like domain-containing RNA-binding protein n=1 Tax=Alkalihalophilus lindianensis TaxID=1630542 RepID=A0ABU3X5I5_9BACI|nr:S1-like domain-containing RNA-binding protein [Alkalihalophilus lindianensis]MDV2683053.1 S1-like domain-containing RNA-binding protein [Alkalihalophilus lindianensis]